MAPPAHSQQVSYEECLLATPLRPDGSLGNTHRLTRSWMTALVKTVGQEAVNQQEPTILAHSASGLPYLVCLSMGRCLLGWPLRFISVEDGILGLIPTSPMATLIITDPCPGKGNHDHAFAMPGHLFFRGAMNVIPQVWHGGVHGLAVKCGLVARRWR